MTDVDLVVRAPRAVTATGDAVSVGVTDGRIVAVEPYASPPRGRRTVELDEDVVLLPGLVDTHVHVNEPGRTEWEGFATATRAAAAGGVTTIVDMPLNSVPPTVDVPALETKRAAAEGHCLVDVGFWGGAVPGNAGELRGLHDAGVFGFKCFLLDLGVPEFPPLGPDELAEHLAALQSFGGLLLVHAEDGASSTRPPGRPIAASSPHVRGRPRTARSPRLIEAARGTGGRAHIVHLSSADAVPMIRSAQREGVHITAETCPHYLVLTAEEVPDGATQYKCCPPIREAANRELLWQALATARSTASSPTTRRARRSSSGSTAATSGWRGAASPGCRWDCPRSGPRPGRRGCTLADVTRWMAAGPAGWPGSAQGPDRRGLRRGPLRLRAGRRVRRGPRQLHHKNPITPYAGRPLTGVVRTTWLRGSEVRNGDAPRGRPLRRGDA